MLSSDGPAMFPMCRRWLARKVDVRGDLTYFRFGGIPGAQADNRIAIAILFRSSSLFRGLQIVDYWLMLSLILASCSRWLACARQIAGKQKSNLGNGDGHFLRCASDVMKSILFHGT